MFIFPTPIQAGSSGLGMRPSGASGQCWRFGIFAFEIGEWRAGNSRFAAHLSSLIEPSKNPARLYGFI
jgi:hypothetical protein